MTAACCWPSPLANGIGGIRLRRLVLMVLPRNPCTTEPIDARNAGRTGGVTLTPRNGKRQGVAQRWGVSLNE